PRQLLTYTDPARSSDARRWALEMSRVHTPAARPYSVSLARAATSSIDSYGRATRTGPKISSREIDSESSVVVKRVGSTKEPPLPAPPAPPPASSSAPSR